MSDKESKLIKLVLAIKQTGFDVEKIYNEEVLNDDSSVAESVRPQQQQRERMQTHVSLSQEADNSGNLPCPTYA